MMALLHRFFWEDSRTRGATYAFTAVAGIIYASVRTLAFQKPERQVNLGIGCISPRLEFHDNSSVLFTRRKNCKSTHCGIHLSDTLFLRYVGAAALSHLAYCAAIDWFSSQPPCQSRPEDAASLGRTDNGGLLPNNITARSEDQTIASPYVPQEEGYPIGGCRSGLTYNFSAS